MKHEDFDLLINRKKILIIFQVIKMEVINNGKKPTCSKTS
jgi:hypothetical protein